MIDVKQETTSWSVFGALDWDLSETLTASLELRVLNEERDATIGRTPFDASCFIAPAPAANVPTRCQTPIAFAGTIDDTLTLPTASLRWRPDPRLTLYARAATGARPGGFNNFAGGAFTYRPEEAVSYEVGLKAAPAPRLSLSLAAYATRLQDAQLTARDTSGTGIILSNIGDAEITGAELDLRWALRLAGGRLVTTAGASTGSGEFTDDALLVNFAGNCPVGAAYARCPAAGPGARALAFVPYPIKDVAVAQLPDLQMNLGLAYARAFANGWQADVSVNYTHRHGGAEEVAPKLAGTDPAFAVLGGAYQSLETYDIFDVRAAVTRGGWTFAVFGRNVGDDRYPLEKLGAGAGAKKILNPPASWGASLRWRR